MVSKFFCSIPFGFRDQAFFIFFSFFFKILETHEKNLTLWWCAIRVLLLNSFWFSRSGVFYYFFIFFKYLKHMKKTEPNGGVLSGYSQELQIWPRSIKTQIFLVFEI